MFGIRTFLVGMMAGATAGLFVSNFHVVNTADGVVVVPRTQRPPLRSSYVDVRQWSAAMWANHPEVAKALVADGRSAVVGASIKEQVLEEVIPNLSEDLQAAPKNIAYRSKTKTRPTEVPVKTEAVLPNSNQGTARLLDNKSSIRNRWESELDQAIAPLVEDDPEDLVAEQQTDILPETPVSDEMVRKIEDRLGDLLNPTQPPSGASDSTPLEAIPASTNSSEMARDLLKQVIPLGHDQPNSAAPLRNLAREILNAPAPGSGTTSSSRPVVPKQSELLQAKPF